MPLQRDPLDRLAPVGGLYPPTQVDDATLLLWRGLYGNGRGQTALTVK
ncbi:MAG: hypothetical protein JNN30_03700 [Rhodanobacteraceae bacterium]|nr:hypothetical protein [Rhodanobacteraceae bacterium]